MEKIVSSEQAQKLWHASGSTTRKIARVFRNDYVMIKGARYRVIKRTPPLGHWLLESRQGFRGKVISLTMSEAEIIKAKAEEDADYAIGKLTMGRLAIDDRNRTGMTHARSVW